MKRLLILISILVVSSLVFFTWNEKYTVEQSFVNATVENALKPIPQNLDKETLKTFN